MPTNIWGDPLTEYHWIMTVRYGEGQFATESGTYTNRAGRHLHRDVIFNEVLKAVRERTAPDAAVVFFDLTANELLGGVR